MRTVEDTRGPIRRVVPFTEPGRRDAGRAGGKNAALGELTNRLGVAGIRILPGFATTAEAYRELLATGDLRRHVEAQIDRLHEGPRSTGSERPSPPLLGGRPFEAEEATWPRRRRCSPGSPKEGE
ncbi:PEP/pyruvate-binding domain-containing protein [Streptomyces sp. NRRL F-5727]|uniref:PEP/pyruvate-binding domain-containing protein n=1 Tax=Streptomyces sp. NRRL F-5727 TaxID=1463871 RepID=UPI002D218D13|nr:PEP/pyruvate-binding domain-containing protein [Streptomyces sp. NRRL F-5727]